MGLQRVLYQKNQKSASAAKLPVRLCQLNNDLEEMDEMVISHKEQEIQEYYPISPAPPDLCG